MKIKSSLAVVAVVFSVALLGGHSVHAEEKTTDKSSEKSEEIVTVKPGDTLEGIAKSHHTSYVKLYNANKKVADPNVIDVGDKIRIPKKSEKLPDRYADYEKTQTATTPAAANAQYTPVYSQTYTPGSEAVYKTDNSGNTYFAGYCTWYAKDRRPDLPNMLGNGGQWVNNAAAQGYNTGSKPKAGAIAETPGHVAYVEKVNSNGTITISEMNGRAGFGKVGTRDVSANKYKYIY